MKLQVPVYRKIYDYSKMAKFLNEHILHEKILIESLQFPHSHLDIMLERYKDFGRKLLGWGVQTLHAMVTVDILSKKELTKIKELQNLYAKILANEADEKKWLECLNEADDEDFVIQNLEYRLGKHPCNKSLWEVYLKYLSSKQNKVIRKVISGSQRKGHIFRKY